MWQRVLKCEFERVSGQVTERACEHACDRVGERVKAGVSRGVWLFVMPLLAWVSSCAIEQSPNDPYDTDVPVFGNGNGDGGVNDLDPDDIFRDTFGGGGDADDDDSSDDDDDDDAGDAGDDDDGSSDDDDSDDDDSDSVTFEVAREFGFEDASEIDGQPWTGDGVEIDEGTLRLTETGSALLRLQSALEGDDVQLRVTFATGTKLGADGGFAFLLGDAGAEAISMCAASVTRKAASGGASQRVTGAIEHPVEGGDERGGSSAGAVMAVVEAAELTREGSRLTLRVTGKAGEGEAATRAELSVSLRATGEGGAQACRGTSLAIQLYGNVESPRVESVTVAYPTSGD